MSKKKFTSKAEKDRFIKEAKSDSKVPTLATTKSRLLTLRQESQKLRTSVPLSLAATVANRPSSKAKVSLSSLLFKMKGEPAAAEEAPAAPEEDDARGGLFTLMTEQGEAETKAATDAAVQAGEVFVGAAVQAGDVFVGWTMFIGAHAMTGRCAARDAQYAFKTGAFGLGYYLETEEGKAALEARAKAEAEPAAEPGAEADAAPVAESESVPGVEQVMAAAREAGTVDVQAGRAEQQAAEPPVAAPEQAMAVEQAVQEALAAAVEKVEKMHVAALEQDVAFVPAPATQTTEVAVALASQGNAATGGGARLEGEPVPPVVERREALDGAEGAGADVDADADADADAKVGADTDADADAGTAVAPAAPVAPGYHRGARFRPDTHGMTGMRPPPPRARSAQAAPVKPAASVPAPAVSPAMLQKMAAWLRKGTSDVQLERLELLQKFGWCEARACFEPALQQSQWLDLVAGLRDFDAEQLRKQQEEEAASQSQEQEAQAEANAERAAVVSTFLKRVSSRSSSFGSELSRSDSNASQEIEVCPLPPVPARGSMAVTAAPRACPRGPFLPPFTPSALPSARSRARRLTTTWTMPS